MNIWNKIIASLGIAVAANVPVLAQQRPNFKPVPTNILIEFEGYQVDVNQAIPLEIRTLRGPLGIVRVKPGSDGRARINFPVDAAMTWAIKAPGLLSDAKAQPDAFGTFKLTLVAGDVSGDNQIDQFDYDLAVAAQGSTPCDGHWNPAADFNLDSRVDAQDLAIVIKNFGRRGTVALATAVPYPRFGDIDGDGLLGQGDFKLLVDAYNSEEGDPNFNKEADLNRDSVVDIADFALLSQAWSI